MSIMVVLRGQLSNPASALETALRAYRKLTLTGVSAVPHASSTARRLQRLTEEQVNNLVVIASGCAGVIAAQGGFSPTAPLWTVLVKLGSGLGLVTSVFIWIRSIIRRFRD